VTTYQKTTTITIPESQSPNRFHLIPAPYFKAYICGRTTEAVQCPSPMFWYGFHGGSRAAKCEKCGNMFSSVVFFVTIVITGGMFWCEGYVSCFMWRRFAGVEIAGPL